MEQKKSMRKSLNDWVDVMVIDCDEDETVKYNHKSFNNNEQQQQ